jgi:hypothetical protein
MTVAIKALQDVNCIKTDADLKDKPKDAYD